MCVNCSTQCLLVVVGSDCSRADGTRNKWNISKIPSGQIPCFIPHLHTGIPPYPWWTRIIVCCYSHIWSIQIHHYPWKATQNMSYWWWASSIWGESEGTQTSPGKAMFWNFRPIHWVWYQRRYFSTLNKAFLLINTFTVCCFSKDSCKCHLPHLSVLKIALWKRALFLFSTAKNYIF